MFTMRQLQLIRESKISKLLSKADKGKKSWEASGVLYRNGRLYVVFDNRAQVASLDTSLTASPDNRLLGEEDKGVGFEGIAYNHVDQTTYLLVESVKEGKREYYAEITPCDDAFRFDKNRRLDFRFEAPNKGFESILYFRSGDENFLLALMEGNHGADGKRGRDVGNGIMQIFRESKKKWKHQSSLPLPKSVRFVDYSAMSWRRSSREAQEKTLQNDAKPDDAKPDDAKPDDANQDDAQRLATIAIASQESSLLWIGDLDLKHWRWMSDGEMYEFPRSSSGKIVYGNIEGVAWLTPTRLACVSDRTKEGEQPDRVKKKDESVHIFELPG